MIWWQKFFLNFSLMNTNQSKSFLLLITTLLIGIVIGMLANGYWTRHRIADMRQTMEKADLFIEEIQETLSLDEATAEQIRPILAVHFARMKEIQQGFRQEMRGEREQFRAALEPHLSAEQMDRLEQKLRLRGKKGRGKRRGGPRSESPDAGPPPPSDRPL